MDITEIIKLNWIRKQKKIIEIRREKEKWEELYRFQQKLRTESQITATDIINQLELPIAFVGYMYSLSSQPSANVETLGHTLRVRLQEVKDGLRTIVPSGDINGRLVEYYHTNKDELYATGIDSLYILDDTLVIRTTPEKASLTEAGREMVRNSPAWAMTWRVDEVH